MSEKYKPNTGGPTKTRGAPTPLPPPVLLQAEARPLATPDTSWLSQAVPGPALRVPWGVEGGCWVNRLPF